MPLTFVLRRLALPLITAALVLGPATPAVAKSYSFPDVTISADVRPDGSMLVREERTFAFDGAFRRAFIRIPRGSYSIEQASVSEGGRAYTRVPRAGDERPGTFVFERGSAYEIRWFYDASDERRTFTVTYLVRGAVVRWDDVAELAWQFIGSEWEVGVGRAQVAVALPEGANADEVRVWGKGPLHGEAEIIDGRLVRLAIDHLPARQFVGARILFPPRLVPGAPSRAGQRLPDVLEEEATEAREANAQREQMRKAFEAQQRRREQMRALFGWLAPLGAAVAFGIFFLLWSRYGREPDVADPGGYLREPPEQYPPALLGYLWRFGAVQPVDMVATLLDLARRGYLEIVEERTEKGVLFKKAEYRYRVHLRRTTGEDLAPHERTLLDLLVEAGDGASVRDDELRDWARSNAATMRERFGTFSSQVKEQGDGLGLVEKGRGGWMALSGLLAVGALALGVAGLFMGSGPEAMFVLVGLLMFAIGSLVFLKNRFVGAFVMLFGGFMAAFVGTVAGVRLALGAMAAIALASAQLVLTPTLRQRTGRGAQQHARWRAFERFLRDFSRMPEKRPTEVALWERYLVYAIPLGAASAVTQAIQLHAPPEVAESGFRWYAWTRDGADHTFSSSFAAFGESFTETTVAAFSSAPSSESGSGGGFSGGGGSFGGGGGGGAS